MHSLAPYSVRVFDRSLPGRAADKYAKLNRIGQFDAYHLLKTFIEQKGSDYHLLEGQKLVYRFTDFVYDDSGRLIYGHLQVGSYGIKSQIIDVDTGEVDYVKTQKNAEIINHFMYFSLPEERNEGVALLQLFRSNGIKTIFFEMFGPFFTSATSLNFQMNPLSYEKAVSDWLSAQAKEIRLVKFSPFDDIADRVKGLGHNEQIEKIMVLKAQRKTSMGRLSDFLNKGSEQAQAVEMLDEMCQQVKTVVELNGRKRTFSIGKSSSIALSEVEAPEDLEYVDGVPTFAAMKQWCDEILEEFSSTLYR